MRTGVLLLVLVACWAALVLAAPSNDDSALAAQDQALLGAEPAGSEITDEIVDALFEGTNYDDEMLDESNAGATDDDGSDDEIGSERQDFLVPIEDVGAEVASGNTELESATSADATNLNDAEGMLTDADVAQLESNADGEALDEVEHGISDDEIAEYEGDDARLDDDLEAELAKEGEATDDIDDTTDSVDDTAGTEATAASDEDSNSDTEGHHKEWREKLKAKKMLRTLRMLAKKRLAWRRMVRAKRIACLRAAFQLRLLKHKIIKHMIKRYIKREIARQIAKYAAEHKFKRDDDADDSSIAVRKFDSSKGNLIGVTIKLKAAFVGRSRYTNLAKDDTPLSIKAAVGFKLAIHKAKKEADDNDDEEKTLMMVTPAKSLSCMAHPSGGHMRRLPVLRALALARRRLDRQHKLMKIFAAHGADSLRLPLLLAIKRLAIATATAPGEAHSDLGVLTNVIAGARLSITYHYAKHKSAEAIKAGHLGRFGLHRFHSNKEFAPIRSLSLFRGGDRFRSVKPYTSMFAYHSKPIRSSSWWSEWSSHPADRLYEKMLARRRHALFNAKPIVLSNDNVSSKDDDKKFNEVKPIVKPIVKPFVKPFGTGTIRSMLHRTRTAGDEFDNLAHE